MKIVDTPPGLYEALPERPGDRTRVMPVLKLRTCDEGCCSELEPATLEIGVGNQIQVSRDAFGPETYMARGQYSDPYEEHYYPHTGTDYVGGGYLKPVTKQD